MICTCAFSRNVVLEQSELSKAEALAEGMQSGMQTLFGIEAGAIQPSPQRSG